MLELKYINEQGETLSLKTDENHHIFFNHTDIHKAPDEFQDVSFAQMGNLNEDEMKVIRGFMELALYFFGKTL
jgi:hypothetical protein